MTLVPPAALVSRTPASIPVTLVLPHLPSPPATAVVPAKQVTLNVAEVPAILMPPEVTPMTKVTKTREAQGITMRTPVTPRAEAVEGESMNSQIQPEAAQVRETKNVYHSTTY